MLIHLEQKRKSDLIEEMAFTSMKSWKLCKEIIFHEDQLGMWVQSDTNSLLFNNILRFNPKLPEFDLFFNALANYKISLRCWVSPAAALPHVISYFTKNNWKFKSEVTGMAIDLDFINEDILINKDIVVHEVSNIEVLQKWASTFAFIFNLSASVKQTWQNVYSAIFNNKQWRHFFVNIGEKSVAVASLFQCEDVAYIAFVATHQHFRSQGIASSLMLQLLKRAREHNCKIATLISTPMAYKIYRQLGFEEYSKYNFYDRVNTNN